MAKTLTSADLINLDPNFLYEVALGLEDGKKIAARYGFTDAQWAAIEKAKYFQIQIDALRAEMERSGVQFGTTCGVMARQLLDLIFTEAMSPDMDIKNRLEALKQFAKYANFEPKTSADAPTGPKFSISISIPSLPKTEVVEIKAKSDAEDAQEIKGPTALTLSFGGEKAPENDKNEVKNDVQDGERDNDNGRACDCDSDCRNDV